MANPRKTAVNILEQVEEGAYLNLALKDPLRGMEDRDRRFVSALVYTTLENLLRIDHVIDSFTEGKKIHRFVRNVLRISVCQMMYFDSVPVSAAVNESVKIVASSPKKALKGFANAVLRNISRHIGEVEYPDEEKEPVRHLSVLFSYPEWIVEKYIDDYGYETAWNMLLFRRPYNQMSVRRNLIRIDEASFEEGLKSICAGFTKGELSPNAYYLKSPSQIDETDLYKEGKLTVQGEASMLVCEMAGKGYDSVLDMCAAPGGKTAYLNELLSPSYMEAWDLHAHRVEIMDWNLKRMGTEATLKIRDATVFDPSIEEKFALVLLDAPCSELGLLYRKPDIKYRKERKDLSSLALLQRKLLDNAARYVKKGGTLIYSTCTIDRTENADNIEAFLKEHGEFSPAEPEGVFEGLKDRIVNGGIQFFPHLDGIDGFYMAKLVKR